MLGEDAGASANPSASLDALRLSHLASLGAALGQADDVQAAAQATAIHVAAVVEADCVSVAFRGEDAVIRVVAAVGGAIPPVCDAAAAQAIATRAAITLPDGPRALVAVPLLGRETAHGALVVALHAVGVTASEQALLEAAAAQCAQAFALLRLREEARDAQVQRRWIRAIVSMLPAPAFLVRGRAHEIELVNARALSRFGGREAVGKRVGEAFPELGARGVPALLDDALARGAPTRRTVVLGGNGSGTPEATFTTTMQPLHGADGTVWGLLVVAVELTDRTTAARRLESEILARLETEHKVEALTDLVPQIVWTAKPDGDVDWANRRFDEYVGPGSRSYVERFRAAIHDDDLARARDTWQRSLATEEPYELEYRLRRHDGVYRWFLVRGLPMRDAAGEVGRWFGTLTDVDDQRRAAEERAALLDGAERARLDAEAASRAKDEFLAMLGHELRNPLAPIVTALNLMKLRGEGASREHAIIERQVKHVVRLVDDLLDVSRITRGKVELYRAPLAIGDVIARAVETASPLLEQLGHAVEVSVPHGLVVDGDELRLTQVFANLITNAAKFTKARGHIAIAARRTGGDIAVSVRDDGAGIAPDLLPRIFEAFVQAPSASDRAEGGLGIGLTLVRSLVRLHGGTVSAASDGPGKGAEFVVCLPALPARAGAPLLARASSPAVRAQTARKVLVVDDNQDAAELLAAWLGRAGCEVRLAADGPEALTAMRRFRAEYVVLDIGLPLMDGYEVARRLREEHGSAPHLIAVTGYGGEKDRQQSAAAGIELHLVKPVDLAELAAALGLAPVV